LLAASETDAILDDIALLFLPVEHTPEIHQPTLEGMSDPLTFWNPAVATAMLTTVALEP
jgi:hypothetical protein